MHTLDDIRRITGVTQLPLSLEQEAWVKSTITDVPDFPKPGILFKDITPMLADPDVFDFMIDVLAERAAACKPELVVGLEARGFLFGTPLARALKIGFAPIRKAGKLPRNSEDEIASLEYGLEYREKDTIEIRRDAVGSGRRRVLVLDDLLATGGTAAAAQELVTNIGGEVVGTGFVIELLYLGGRARLMQGPDTFSVLSYS